MENFAEHRQYRSAATDYTGKGSYQSYSRSDPGSFRSYFLSVRSFRPGSFRPNFRGWSFRSNFGGSFRPTLFYIDFFFCNKSFLGGLIDCMHF